MKTFVTLDKCAGKTIEATTQWWDEYRVITFTDGTYAHFKAVHFSDREPDIEEEEIEMHTGDVSPEVAILIGIYTQEAYDKQKAESRANDEARQRINDHYELRRLMVKQDIPIPPGFDDWTPPTPGGGQ